MGDVAKDLTGIAMAIVGVAVLTVILRPSSQTTQVIGAASGGFSQALSTAMGGGFSGGYGGYGGYSGGASMYGIP